MQASFQTKPRARRDHADNSVSSGFKAVHPIGHPISHSTNCGFKARRVVDDGWPSEVSGSGGEEIKAACPPSRSSFDRSPPRVSWLPCAIAAVGVDQSQATKFTSCCPRFDVAFRLSWLSWLFGER